MATMHYCEECGRDFTNPFCPRCGGPPASRTSKTGVSDPGDTLDTMIEQASRPTLASLLKRGIDSGVIKPTHNYAFGSPEA